jgi:uncharacterized protein YxjI
MFRRHRNQHPDAPVGIHRYQMRQKLLAFGDDYYIENEQGQRIFHVDGKMLRLRDTLYFKDMHGQELLKIQEKWLHARDTMNIYRGKDVVASVHEAFVQVVRDRYKINVPHGPDLIAHGNILDHEYVIEQDSWKIAEISKKWFRVRDTYGVEIAPGQDDILLLAITVVIDQMAHG